MKTYMNKCNTAMQFLFLILFATLSYAKGDALHVLTSSTTLKSIAEEIGGDKITVKSVGSPFEDPHFIEAKPSTIIDARNADLFIVIGMEMEIGWVPVVIDGARNPKIRPGATGYLDASAAITPIEVPSGAVNRSMGDVHPFGNPHYWMDPLNGKKIALLIAERLSMLVPEHKETFSKNSEKFNLRIDSKLKEWQAALAPYHGTKIVTYHKSWVYFSKRFGFVEAEYLEPKPGIEPSPKHLVKVINSMKADTIRIVLQETFYRDKAAKAVASKTNAIVVKAPISVGGAEGADDYISLFDIIVSRLVHALKQM